MCPRDLFWVCRNDPRGCNLRAYAGDFVDIKTGEWIEKVTKIEGGFEIKTDKETYQAKSVLVATGSHRRQLPVTGAEKLKVYKMKGKLKHLHFFRVNYDVRVVFIWKDQQTAELRSIGPHDFYKNLQ